MKKFILGACILLASASAHATGLSVIGSTAITFTGYDGEPVIYTGARNNGEIGTITASSAGLLEAVYLGQESVHFNLFNFSLFNGLNELNDPGDSIVKNISTPGAISFAFTDLTNIFNQFNNGSSAIVVMSGIIPSTVFNGDNNGPFDYILGFNDRGRGDADYDDFVVGLRFTPSAVPLPAAFPLMATALALFGFGAGRRRL